VWLPNALIRLPSCRGNDTFLVDCCFSALADNPFLRLVLLKKVPKNLKLVTRPPIEAPRLEPLRCSEGDIIKDFNEVYEQLSSGVAPKLDSLVEAFTKPKDLKIRITTFPLLGIRKRTYVVPAQRIFETSRRIAFTTLSNVAKKLCIGTPSMYPLEISHVYVLGCIDPYRRVVDLVLGKKIVSSASHFTAIESFPKIESEISKIVGEERSEGEERGFGI